MAGECPEVAKRRALAIRHSYADKQAPGLWQDSHRPGVFAFFWEQKVIIFQCCPGFSGAFWPLPPSRHLLSDTGRQKRPQFWCSCLRPYFQRKAAIPHFKGWRFMCLDVNNGYRYPYFYIISYFDTLAPIFTNSDTDNLICTIFCFLIRII